MVTGSRASWDRLENTGGGQGEETVTTVTSQAGAEAEESTDLQLQQHGNVRSVRVRLHSNHTC